MGPTLECSFVSANLTSNQSYLRVVEFLAQNGGELHAFKRIECETRDVCLLDGGTLSDYMRFASSVADSDCYMLSSNLGAWIAKSTGRDETLTNEDYGDALPPDKAVRIECAVPEWIVEMQDPSKSVIGKEIANNFLRICCDVEPLYATITIEQTLESPQQLIEGAESYAFRNFYVSNKIGSEIMSTLLDVFQSASILVLPKGAYISNDEEFSLNGNFNPSFNWSLSIEAGRALGLSLYTPM